MGRTIGRGERFAEAGADAFLLGDPVPLEDIETLVDAVELPYYALGVHSGDEEFQTWRTLGEYDDAGVSLVSDVGGLLQAAVTAMEAYLRSMQREGTYEEDPKTLAALSDFLGAEDYGRFEDRFRRTDG
ncbi:MAG: isocitrate lyase/phosphoenolpyruvate mutase family protein [Haloferacaceae archaeon]